MYAGYRLRTIGQCGYSVSTSHTINFMHPTKIRRHQCSRVGLTIWSCRCADYDARNSCDAGWCRQHVHYRWKSSLATRNVEANAADRRDFLARHDARCNLREPLLMRHLPLMKDPYIANSLLDGCIHILIEDLIRAFDVLPAHTQPISTQSRPIKTLYVFEQRRITTVTHPSYYGAHVIEQIIDSRFSTTQQARSLICIES